VVLGVFVTQRPSTFTTSDEEGKGADATDVDPMAVPSIDKWVASVEPVQGQSMAKLWEAAEAMGEQAHFCIHYQLSANSFAFGSCVSQLGYLSDSNNGSSNDENIGAIILERFRLGEASLLRYVSNCR
jgi:hypothetical protein